MSEDERVKSGWTFMPPMVERLAKQLPVEHRNIDAEQTYWRDRSKVQGGQERLFEVALIRTLVHK